MRSPFKFLDSYTLADSKQFFGRDKEIASLYKMVFETQLIVVYGLSGTGKTSLVQCGLANKFEGPDWHPFFIRRNKNINNSLHQAIDKAIGIEAELSLVEKINYLNTEYFRPVYLIFDQFEELFILGTEEEQELFIQSIKSLLEIKLLCKVILIIREEFLGSLYEFEKTVPYIRDFQLRVESVNSKIAKEIISSSFKKFNVRLDKPEEELLQLITDNLSGEKSVIQLPYLQVYLDRLYQIGFKKKYPKGSKKSFPRLKFTKEEIEFLGEIENVLEHFFVDKKNALHELVEQEYNISAPPLDELFNILVTENKTKQPIYFRREEELILIEDHMPYKEFLPSIPEIPLSYCINFLAENRIIRFLGDSYFELAHDSLAEIIDRKITDEQREMRNILRSIASNYDDYLISNDSFLSERQLLRYGPYEKDIKLRNVDYYNFIVKSGEKIEEEKVRREQERLEMEKAKRRIADRNIWLKVAGVFLLLVTASGFYVNEQKIIAENSAQEAAKSNEQLIERNNENEKLTYLNYILTGQKFKQSGDFDQALKELEKAIDFKKEKDKESVSNLEHPSLDSLKTMHCNWYEAGLLYSDGVNILLGWDGGQSDIELKKALEKFKKAFKIVPDNHIKDKIENVKIQMRNKFDQWLLRAEHFITFRQCSKAREAIGVAEDLIFDSEKKSQNADIDKMEEELKLLEERGCSDGI